LVFQFAAIYLPVTSMVAEFIIPPGLYFSAKSPLIHA
jgi:hypothetical protein